MSKKYADLVYEDKHHIHHLSGLFHKDKEYSIDIDVQPGTGEVYVNNKLDTYDLAIFKQLVKREVKAEQNKDYYVTLTPKAAAPLRRQVGGYKLFPLRLRPYSCDDTVFDITHTIFCYSEPSIDYIERLGARTYTELIDVHSRAGVIEFNDRIAMITPDNYADYRKVLLAHHLNTNKYAHNGIDEADMNEILRRSTRGDYPMLQFIHSILHIYDMLYTCQKISSEFRANKEELRYFTYIISDERLRYCFFMLLNKNAGEALLRAPDGDFILPYTFAPEAILNKDRQYGDMRGIIIPSLEHQLITRTLMPPTGTTPDLPNT